MYVICGKINLLINSLNGMLVLGLFHKAIMHSGFMQCSWARNQSLPERGFKLASLLGKDSSDPEEVVEFLRSVPAEDIIKAQSSILTREANDLFFFFFIDIYIVTFIIETN